MKEAITDREWPTMHAVWRQGLVTTKAVHEWLLDQGHVLDRRKSDLLLKSLTEKGYLRARKLGRVWSFVAMAEPEEAFEVLWAQVRKIALDADAEHVRTFLSVARKG